MPRNKETITRAVLEMQEFPITLEVALVSWWVNIRAVGGLRLSKHGYLSFQSAEIESWTVEMKDIRSAMSKRLLLDLDRKLQFPYYIDYKNKSIVFYSSKEAMLAQLYGDIPTFVKNYG